MKVSIISVCLNSEKYIRNAIESVVNQDYTNIEYIVVDGQSTDNTLNIINEYINQITIIISEKDSGLYDAMNKGIMAASGDIVCMLNSDDFYENNQIITQIVCAFENKDCDVLFADLLYVDANDTNILKRRWKSSDFKPGMFRKGWHPAHPTFVLKREFYQKYGVFDLSYQLASDIELMFRFLEKYQLKSYYLPQQIIRMRIGGATNKSLKNIFLANKETMQMFKKHNFTVPWFYPVMKIGRKILQYF